MPKSGLTSTQEGYGWPQEKARRRLLAELRAAGVGQCCRCGRAIWPEQAAMLDADHWQSRKPDPPDALAHRSCNRRAGAHVTNSRRRGRRPRREQRAAPRSVPLPTW